MSSSIRSRAFVGLGVLTAINLLNYLDRYILAGVMTKVQSAFELSDAAGGTLISTFMAVYLAASPVAGLLGDRMPRRILLGVSVLLWSVATIASGLAPSFGWLLLARAATGIGEAGYGSVAPAYIADLFAPEKRSRMLAVFYTAMPLGAALGFVLGGFLGDRFGWQSAFFVGGAPGLLLGVGAFFLYEPQRGATDVDAPKVTLTQGFQALLGNVSFWAVTAGLTLMTFSVGGLSNWMPKFLERERGFSATAAGLALGATTVVGGFVGTLLGGVLGDHLERQKKGSAVAMSGWGLVAAAPLMVLSAYAQNPTVLLAALLLAQFFIFLNNGPLNAAIANVVSPNSRAFAFSLSTLTLHLLGDTASPPLIGFISDRFSLGSAIAVNAVPVCIGGLVLLFAVPLFRRRSA
jgi:MFS transporter, Spinster family, sphingosine-1-phosphate transporter